MKKNEFIPIKIKRKTKKDKRLDSNWQYLLEILKDKKN